MLLKQSLLLIPMQEVSYINRLLRISSVFFVDTNSKFKNIILCGKVLGFEELATSIYLD